MSWNDGKADILTTARSEMAGQPYSKADPLLCLHTLRQRILLSCHDARARGWGPGVDDVEGEIELRV